MPNYDEIANAHTALSDNTDTVYRYHEHRVTFGDPPLVGDLLIMFGQPINTCGWTRTDQGAYWRTWMPYDTWPPAELHPVAIVRPGDVGEQ